MEPREEKNIQTTDYDRSIPSDGSVAAKIVSHTYSGRRRAGERERELVLMISWLRVFPLSLFSLKEINTYN